MLNIQFNNTPMNVLIDTGASCSIIDIGSIFKLGLYEKIKPHGDQLINALGIPMDIIVMADSSSGK